MMARSLVSGGIVVLLCTFMPTEVFAGDGAESEGGSSESTQEATKKDDESSGSGEGEPPRRVCPSCGEEHEYHEFVHPCRGVSAWPLVLFPIMLGFGVAVGIPDLRYEYGIGRSHRTYSWPLWVSLLSARVATDSDGGCVFCYRLRGGVELHRPRTADPSNRYLVVSRQEFIWFFEDNGQLLGIFDAGYQWSPGAVGRQGPVVGAGLGIGSGQTSSARLNLVYRHLFAEEASRSSLGLELQFTLFWEEMWERRIRVLPSTLLFRR